MHTYQNATESLLDLPVSKDELISLQLLDPEVNGMIASLDRDANMLAKNPLVLDTIGATVDELLGGRRVDGKLVTGRAAAASAISQRRKRMKGWRRTTGVPVPINSSVKNLRANGTAL